MKNIEIMNEVNLEGKKYTGCQFNNICKSSFIRCKFVNCYFSSIVLHAVDFFECDFVECAFNGCSMIDVEFDSDCIIEDCWGFCNLRIFDKSYISARFVNTSLPNKAPGGQLVGYKMVSNLNRLGYKVIKLEIPADSRRVGGVCGNKYRCEYAVPSGSGYSPHWYLEYKKGKRIECDVYNDNPFVECSGGIHFFLTRQEAKDYIEEF